MEIMVVLAIIAILLLIAVPVFRSSADHAARAVLEENARIIETKIDVLVQEGYDTSYRRSDSGDPNIHLSRRLEEDLRGDADQQSNAENFRNPYADTMSIVNWPSPNVATWETPPAVFITGSSLYRYAVIADNPNRLAGAIVVNLNPADEVVEIFYMDGAGKKSPEVSKTSWE